MRKIVLAMLLGAFLMGSTGCVIPAYSGDPAKRTSQLYNTSEDLRQIQETWERVWMLDQPSHMTPYRTHGGIT
ncbi:MAG: hypothetical protein Q4G68_10755 [Planctomycetia bacterium]|nr:hypothetical protein [Planctomycetia bacterium]